MTENTPIYDTPPDIERARQLLAARLESHPTSMASVLATYRKREGLSMQRLRETLGLTDTQLSRLALCSRPRTQTPGFAEDVKRIAEHTGVDVMTLAQIVRTTDALDSLPDRQLEGSQDPATNPAITHPRPLTAARDRSAAEMPEVSEFRRLQSRTVHDAEALALYSLMPAPPPEPSEPADEIPLVEAPESLESPESPDDKDADEPGEPLAGQ
jgi:transcriptional regulator with XRE-family HTH domain